MQLRVSIQTSYAFLAWTDRFIEGLREEIHAIHVQEQDRAFLATGKGMSYAPYDATQHGLAERPTTH